MRKLSASSSTHFRKFHFNQAGFSLYELLITIAIILILSTIAFFLYKQTAKRSLLQAAALDISTRLEQAETLAQADNREYRIVFDQANNSYTPQFDSSLQTSPPNPPNWAAAGKISTQTITLNTTIRYYNALTSYNPPVGTITINADGQPVGTPTTSAPLTQLEIRFNSRGFPVEWAPAPLAPPTALRAQNAIFLTDGKNFFAVTVTILGRVLIWSYDTSNQVWVRFSR